MARKFDYLMVSTILTLSAWAVFGTVQYSSATSSLQRAGTVETVAGPKYPLVTLEIPSLINGTEVPGVILSSLQKTVIEELRKKNLFADVLPATEVLDGVLTIQGTVVAWEEKSSLGQRGSSGALTVQLEIFQKIVTCPFNRTVIQGVVNPAMLTTGSLPADHALVKGTLDFLTAVTGDE